MKICIVLIVVIFFLCFLDYPEVTVEVKRNLTKRAFVMVSFKLNEDKAVKTVVSLL